MTIHVSTGAGLCKNISDVENVRNLLDTVHAITYGSYTWTEEAGRSGQCMWYDPESQTSKNALELKNKGVHDLISNVLPTLVSLHDGHRAKIRIALAMRVENEIMHSCAELKRHGVHEIIDELEIGWCPHFKTAMTNSTLTDTMVVLNQRLRETVAYPGKKALKIIPGLGFGILSEIVRLCESYGIEKIVTANSLFHKGKIAEDMPENILEGSIAGAPLLEDTLRQVRDLVQICTYRHNCTIKTEASGGVVSADAIHACEKAGACGVYMTTIPYFEGQEAVQKIIQDYHFG